jgi:hypothetical protein
MFCCCQCSQRIVRLVFGELRPNYLLDSHFEITFGFLVKICLGIDVLKIGLRYFERLGLIFGPLPKYWARFFMTERASSRLWKKITSLLYSSSSPCPRSNATWVAIPLYKTFLDITMNFSIQKDKSWGIEKSTKNWFYIVTSIDFTYLNTKMNVVGHFT